MVSVEAPADPAGLAEAAVAADPPTVPHATSAAATALAAHRVLMRPRPFARAWLIVWACMLASLQLVSSNVRRRPQSYIGVSPAVLSGLAPMSSACFNAS